MNENLLPVVDPVITASTTSLGQAYVLLALILIALGIATFVGWILSRREKLGVETTLIGRFNRKIRVWWTMVAIFAIGLLLHRVGVVVLFFLVSFWAMREFITMTPTRRGDHRTLFWIFFIFTPLQYVLVGLGNEYYDYYSIVIPVYASLFVPARAAIAGDYKRFLERSAKIQFGLLICVYSLSHAPALLDLDLVRTASIAGGSKIPWTGSNLSVMIFFVLIAQLSLVLERAWSVFAGKHVIAEKINASRTWEGVFGSMVSTGLIAAALYWATPFYPWEAGVMGVLVTILASAGTLTMSAIKRDRGVTDTGTLVQGHAGVLDQIDNICFAAPVFFHVTRFFFTA